MKKVMKKVTGSHVQVPVTFCFGFHMRVQSQ